MKELVDAIGKQCPIPIVLAKKKIEEMGSGTITVAVDNEIAVENLKKLSAQKGYTFESRKVSDNRYEADLTFEGVKAASYEDNSDEAQYAACSVSGGNEVVVISSDQMGVGDESLGKTLLKGFIYALSSQDSLPKTMLFYNRGAYLTTEGSDSLEDLKSLEASGVEILTCGTCLNHYGLTEKLRVGSVTNMYSITEKMTAADKIVKP